MEDAAFIRSLKGSAKDCPDFYSHFHAMTPLATYIDVVIIRNIDRDENGK